MCMCVCIFVYLLRYIRVFEIRCSSPGQTTVTAMPPAHIDILWKNVARASVAHVKEVANNHDVHISITTVRSSWSKITNQNIICIVFQSIMSCSSV